MKDSIFDNFQYLRLLDQAQTHYENINLHLASSNEEALAIAPIELLSIFLLTPSSHSLPPFQEETIQSLKELVAEALYGENKLQYFSKETLEKLFMISNSYRITDTLNKELSLKYAEYLNNSGKLISPIGIPILENIL